MQQRRRQQQEQLEDGDAALMLQGANGAAVAGQVSPDPACLLAPFLPPLPHDFTAYFAATFRLPLQDVFEDDAAVHLVMELCEGGSVLDGLKDGEYSERQVGAASSARWEARWLPGGHGQCLLLTHGSHDVGAAAACNYSHLCTSSHQLIRCVRVLLRLLRLLCLLQVAHIMRAVVRFIAQCHAKGLIYRDIKPGEASKQRCLRAGRQASSRCCSGCQRFAAR